MATISLALGLICLNWTSQFRVPVCLFVCLFLRHEEEVYFNPIRDDHPNSSCAFYHPETATAVFKAMGQMCPEISFWQTKCVCSGGWSHKVEYMYSDMNLLWRTRCVIATNKLTANEFLLSTSCVWLYHPITWTVCVAENKGGRAKEREIGSEWNISLPFTTQNIHCTTYYLFKRRQCALWINRYRLHCCHMTSQSTTVKFTFIRVTIKCHE